MPSACFPSSDLTARSDPNCLVALLFFWPPPEHDRWLAIPMGFVSARPALGRQAWNLSALQRKVEVLMHSQQQECQTSPHPSTSHHARLAKHSTMFRAVSCWAMKPLS